jgi:hypothetical protein
MSGRNFKTEAAIKPEQITTVLRTGVSSYPTVQRLIRPLNLVEPVTFADAFSTSLDGNSPALYG